LPHAQSVHDGFDSAPDGTVTALALQEDGMVLVADVFASIADLSLHADGKLVVADGFTAIDGLPRLSPDRSIR
jgi:hypothetical protein